MLVTVPSGQVVFDQITQDRNASVRCAPVRSAPVRSAPVRSVPRHFHGGTWRVRDDGLKLPAMRWASTRESPTYQLSNPGLTE